jgi:tubulin-folding cofactor B
MNAIAAHAGDDPFNAVRNMNQGQKAILRQYVTGADHKEYTQLADGTCQLNITHSNLKQQILQQRLSLHSTILEIKEKLYHHCGTSPGYMELHLQNTNVGLGGTVAVMNDNSKKLGYYSPQNGMTIHIVDKDPTSLAKSGWLENVNLVKKYEISEEDYDKREKTVRNYKREQLAKDPNWKPKCQMDVPGKENNTPPPGKESVEGMEVGNRCEVQPGARRGTVMYVGEAKEGGGLGPGHWVGVKFDEPLGKHDGSVKGVKYFECPAKHGAFVRGKNLEVGDFPEIDPFADLSDSDEEM